MARTLLKQVDEASDDFFAGVLGGIVADASHAWYKNH